MTDTADLAALFPEPIEAYVAELATADEPPPVAIGACLIRYGEAGPQLREILARGAEGKVTSESEASQLFRALHIAGGVRDPLAFPFMLNLLRLPEDDLEWLLGDAMTETLPRIAAGVFDGDAEALFQAIGDPATDWIVRSSLLRAATFLTWEGRIDRSRMVTFLEEFGGRAPDENEELVLADWANAISLLGLRHLEPLVSAVETQGRLDEDLFARDAFEKQLAEAERTPGDGTRFRETGLGYIDDVLEALQLFPHDPDAGSSEKDFDDAPLQEPVINPWRHVGRNDPCPCGSGKKAKRCCLAA